jgi:hypothetical protein
LIKYLLKVGNSTPMEIPPLTYEVGRSLRKLGEDYTNDFPIICDKEVVSRYSDINDELEDRTIYHLSILGNHKIILSRA